MQNPKMRLLVVLLLSAFLLNAGCPGKEATLFKNMVTRFGRPPELTVFDKKTGQKKRWKLKSILREWWQGK